MKEADEKAFVALMTTLPASQNARRVGDTRRSLGQQVALDKYTGEIASALQATVVDASKSETARADAAGKLIAFRPGDADAANALLGKSRRKRRRNWRQELSPPSRNRTRRESRTLS